MLSVLALSLELNGKAFQEGRNLRIEYKISTAIKISPMSGDSGSMMLRYNFYKSRLTGPTIDISQSPNVKVVHVDTMVFIVP